MQKRQMLALALVLAVCSFTAFGQEPATATSTGPAGPPMPDPNQPAAGPILNVIPGDCMGFYAARNIKDLLAGCEKFTGDIGMGEMLKSVAPGGLLQMTVISLSLGQGYNPNGGAAAVVLNLEKCGIDVDKLIETGDTDEKFPVVILLAGKDVKKVFPGVQEVDGKVTVILGNEKMYTAQIGDYIALSPNEKALALLGKGKSAADTIGGAHKALAEKSDLMMYLNAPAITPIINKFVKSQEAKQKKAAEAAKEVAKEGDEEIPTDVETFMTAPMGMMMDSLKQASEQFDQIGGVTMGVRFAPTGLVLESVQDYLPDTKLAKQLAATKVTTKPLVGRLPNLPYVLAVGSTASSAQSKEAIESAVRSMKQLLLLGGLELPEVLEQKIINLGTEISEEVVSVQLVGGAPKGKGMFGFAQVIECKDAAKMKTFIPRKVILANEFVQKTLAKTEEDFETLEFKYIENVDTVAGLQIDAVEIVHKDLAEMEVDEKADMVLALGEDKLRFLVAQVDPKTLVVTFGGSKEFLAEAIAAARKGGTIPTDPGVVAAMKMMPKEKVAIVLFSPKNFFDTLQAAAKKKGETLPIPEGVEFEAETPITIGATVKGNAVSSVMYIPTDVVKDMVKIGMACAAGPATAPAAVEVEEDVEVVEEESPNKSEKPEKKTPPAKEK